jgi:hypothetical protein
MGDDDLDFVHASQYRGMTAGVAPGLSSPDGPDFPGGPAGLVVVHDDVLCFMFFVLEAD